MGKQPNFLYMWCKFTELYELNEVSNNFQFWKFYCFIFPILEIISIFASKSRKYEIINK